MLLNDMLFNIVDLPNKLFQFILEEGIDLHANITSWKDNFQLSNEFLTEAAISGAITFNICSVFSFIFLNWYASSINNSNSNSNSNSNNSTKSKSIVNARGNASAGKEQMGMLILGKKMNMLKGIYLQSVTEVNNVGKKISYMFQKDHTYWLLLRVRLRNSIDMFGTKFQLNNDDSCDTKKSFQTKDAYLTMRFKIISDVTGKDFGNVVVRFMNLLNHSSDSKYYTSDFIICAICTSPPNIPIPNEFQNGLNHIGYEMENYINVNAKTVTGDNTIAYSLMLPVKDIHDLFMDVYNNCLFESKKYVIDDNNNETWDGNKIIKQILETPF
jgi:hypothetical protein